MDYFYQYEIKNNSNYEIIIIVNKLSRTHSVTPILIHRVRVSTMI